MKLLLFNYFWPLKSCFHKIQLKIGIHLNTCLLIMWELDYEGSWVPKNWCFWTVVLEKILESPLDCKEIQPVHPKGNQSWMFIGRSDAEAETPILWPPDAKNWLTGKKTWCWERLKVGREGDDRGWDGWIASPTQWTWVWVNSGSWWWTGRPGVSMWLQSWTQLSNWTELLIRVPKLFFLHQLHLSCITYNFYLI